MEEEVGAVGVESPFEIIYAPVAGASSDFEILQLPPVGGAPATPATPAEAEAEAEEEAPGVFEDVGRGLLSAPVTLVQGIAELGALGIDAVFDTDASRATTEVFEYAKEAIGATPKGGAGKVVQDLGAFVLGFIPILGWLGRAGTVAKATQAGRAVAPASSRFFKTADAFGKSATGQRMLSTRAGLIGSTAAATFGYETVITPDGRATLSDVFDTYSPELLQTETDTGLTGRDEALRRLRNRLRSGAEGALLSLGFDTALEGLSAATGAIGRTEAGAAAARGVRKGAALLGQQALRVPGAQKAGEFFRRYFTSSGGADPRVYEELQDTVARVDATQRRAVEAYDNAMNEFMGAAEIMGQGPTYAKQVEVDFFNYLTGAGDLSRYPRSVQEAAEKVLRVGEDLQDSFLAKLESMADEALDGTVRKTRLQAAVKEIKELQDSQTRYLRRKFEIYENPVRFYEGLRFDSPVHQRAVDEVAQHLHRGLGDTWRSPEAQALARYRVNSYLGLEAVNRGTPPEQAAKEMVESLRANAAGPQGSIFAAEAPALKLSPSLLSKREELLDESPSLRELLGEVKDPARLYFDTIGDMSKTLGALRFYTDMRRSGLVTALADAVPALDRGSRPAFVQSPRSMSLASPEDADFAIRPFVEEARRLNQAVTAPARAALADEAGAEAVQVTPRQLIEDYERALVNRGYVPLSQVDHSDVFVGAYGDLTGMYAAPEVYAAMTAPLRLGINFGNEALSIASQLRAITQKMTIVPNPAAQVRNILGNAIGVSSNGNLGRDTDLSGVFKIFMTNMADLNDAGLQRLARAVELTGVKESSLVVEALREYKRAGEELVLSGKLKKAIDRAEDFVPFLRWFEKTYSNSDSFFKAVALLGEQNKLLHAAAKAGVNPNDVAFLRELQLNGLAKRISSRASPELSGVEVVAGDVVKDTMPIHNRVVPAVKALDRFSLFGTFTSFAAENIRNSVGILDRGLKEMSFEAGPAFRERHGEEAAKRLEQAIRSQGAQRLAAYAATATVVPQAIVRTAMVATGTTEEQMEELYSRLPEYLAGHDIVVLSNDQNGRFQYIDLSYVSPYAFVLDPVKAALRAYSEAGRLDKSEVQQLTDAALAGIGGYADPFGSESMIFERVRDVLPKSGLGSLGVGRGGVTATGAKIYNPTDSAADKAFASATHLFDSFLPEYANLVVEERGGEWRPGRLSRAALGIPGPQGQEFNGPAELARLVTGFTPMEMNLQRDFYFAGLEYSPRRTDAKTAATRILTSPDRTPERMVSAWETYLDNLYREQSKLYRSVQAARALGLSDREIRRQLTQKANLGAAEVNAIVKGKFYPGTATSELAAEINAARRDPEVNIRASEVPLTQLRRMSRARNGETLRPEMVAEREGGATAPVAPRPAIPEPEYEILGRVAAPPPPLVGRGPASAPPQPMQMPARTAPLSPALLGGDPLSQAANAEIARRLSGQ